MSLRFGAFLALWAGAGLAGGAVIPTESGMTWSYRLTQQLGAGVSLPGATQNEDGSMRSDVIYRVAGTENLDGTKVWKFEMHRDGMITNTDLILVDEHGIHCVGRVGTDGNRISLEPAQTMVAAPLTADLTWDFDGKAGTTAVRQHYAVAGEEDITVPAGQFHAFHIHAEQTEPDAMTIDRWFVPGTGIVKDITTMRNKEGDLLQRIELELKEKPKVAPRPEIRATKKLAVGLSSEAIGNFKTDVSTETPKIYARWQGHGLRNQAKVRVLWIAEDVGEVAAPNYKIDEATAAATIPEARGVFTLSRPDDGWAPGRYRVEFYVDDQLIDTVKLKINRPNRFN